MKAYSSDLRERMVVACRTGLTQPAVAAQFSVSLSFLAKLLHRQRTSGSVLARPPGRGPAPRLDAAALIQLTACLRQTPDATLDELRGELAATGGPAVSRSALGRTVQGLGWRRKKRASTPPNAAPSG